MKVSRSSAPPVAVRTRRAYFDCQFGQLHVRTAFPSTGGFDEQVTLFCLHSADTSSRLFGGILPELADVRSVYAPDLPGFGESDASPSGSVAEAAIAISDLANDLRLRQIDLMGIQFGADVALQLTAARPELVRRLVLAGAPAAERITAVKQPHRLIDLAAYGSDPLGADSQKLTKPIAAFLSGRA